MTDQDPPPEPRTETTWQRVRPWLAFAIALAVFVVGFLQWRDIGGDPGTIDSLADLAPADDTATAPSFASGAPSTTTNGISVLIEPGPDDALVQLYDELGLDVPTMALARDQRPGCPPPPPEPSTGGGPGSTPWSPSVTIAEEALPAPVPMISWASDASPAAGKGMWIWKYSLTEDENFQAIVDRAVQADLDHLWIRVGDSRDGFYAAQRMEALVPLAHAAGLDVIGWGFPFLHDPLGDAAWSAQAMAWRGSDGQGLDAFSPDIERETENVKLTARRVEVYLAALRQAAGDLPVLATVYPPEDWVVESGYPYEAIAPWVDALVPMDYWGCGDAGLMAFNSITRLAHLGKPIHVIGQAYGNTGSGRRVAPNQQETRRFLDVAVREGAIGASFWVWQTMEQHQWDALTTYPWDRAVAVSVR